MKKNHFRLQSLAAIIGVFFLADVGATPITNWGYRIESGFTAFTSTGGSGSGVVGSNTNTEWAAPSTLTWGAGTGPGISAGRSGIDVGGASNGTATGTVITDGGAVSTVTFTHTNNVISGGSDSLTTATLSDRIYLDPLLPAPPYDPTPGDQFSPPDLTFGINFTETTNGGTCAAASPPGNPCNDIFVLDIVGAGFNPLNNSINQNFFFADPDTAELHAYNARIFIDGIGLLPDDTCLAAGAAINCIGLTTIEGQANTFQVSLDITTEQFYIPEPTTLLLMGLGLLGIGYRRKQ